MNVESGLKSGLNVQRGKERRAKGGRRKRMHKLTVRYQKALAAATKERKASCKA